MRFFILNLAKTMPLQLTGRDISSGASDQPMQPNRLLCAPKYALRGRAPEFSLETVTKKQTI